MALLNSTVMKKNEKLVNFKYKSIVWDNLSQDLFKNMK